MKQSDVALRACGRAIALGLLLVVATGASATVVSGRVTNVTGSGIANVDLDFVNRDTDENIPLVGDDTDPLGFYAVTVPVGDYDVRFNPPKGVRYAAHEERGVQVQGGSMTLDATLDDAWLVSGRVVDEFAAPLVNVDLDFVDMIDGGDAYVSNDSSDAAGQFTVAVRATTYQIEFEPPLGMPRAPRRLDDVVVSGDVALGDIVLDPGFTLSGVVRNGVATGLGSILVRTTDPWTGDEIFSIRNVTDGTGAYSFLVAAGNYTLELIPPRGARQLPRRVAGVAVSGALALPAIVLDDGVLVRGRVLDPGGSPAAGTDLDFVSALSDHRMWTPRDNADDGGDFEIAVPQGTYHILYDPPFATGWAREELRDRAIVVDETLPTLTLAVGADVSGTIVNSLAQPVEGVDLDFLRTVDGLEIPSARDSTDPLGAFSARVRHGTYDIEFSPTGGGHGRRTEPNVAVAGSLDLGTLALPVATAASTTGVAPASGSERGGTTVTIGGTGFAPGAKVRFGGIASDSVQWIGAGTLEAVSPPHRTGLVDVEVINIGATSGVLVSSFTFTPEATAPFLTLDKVGPLATDLRLFWNVTGQASYTIYKSTHPDFSMPQDFLDRTESAEFRDDGGAGPASPPLVFYLVQ